MISDGLEVATDKEQLNLVVIRVFQRLDLLVDSIECAVATAFDSDLQVNCSVNRNTLRTHQLTFMVTRLVELRQLRHCKCMFTLGCQAVRFGWDFQLEDKGQTQDQDDHSIVFFCSVSFANRGRYSPKT